MAIRMEEGDRPLHSDNTPSLNIRFFAGRGTPVSAQAGCKSELEEADEKLVSESNSIVEMLS